MQMLRSLQRFTDLKNKEVGFESMKLWEKNMLKYDILVSTAGHLIKPLYFDFFDALRKTVKAHNLNVKQEQHEQKKDER